MDLHISSNVIWYLAGVASASIVWLALFAALVYLAMRAKARREGKEDSP